jgi:hypothetical protein
MPELSDDQAEAMLWKVIGRYDHYYASTNVKASLLIAFNVLVISTIILKWSEAIALIDNSMLQGLLV